MLRKGPTFYSRQFVLSQEQVVESNLRPCSAQDLITMQDLECMQFCENLHVLLSELLRYYLTSKGLEVWDVLEKQSRSVVRVRTRTDPPVEYQLLCCS